MKTGNNIAEKAKGVLSNYVGNALDEFAFVGEKPRIFTMKLINNHATASKKVVLFSGLAKDIDAFNALTGAGADGFVTASIGDMVNEGSPQDFAIAQAFFNLNPANIAKITMRVTNSLQFENPFKVYEGLNPFDSPKTETILPATYKNPNQADDKSVIIENMRLQWNDQVGLVVDVNALTTVTISFFVNAIGNSAYNLDRALTASVSMRKMEV